MFEFVSGNTDCLKDEIWIAIKDRIKCSFPGFEVFYPFNLSLPRCETFEAAASAFSEMNNFSMLVGISESKCRFSCATKRFAIDVKQMHINSLVEVDKKEPPTATSTTTIAIAYSTLVVEESIERLVYDFENLLTAVGGNLGLFLGFSCFSSSMFLIKYFCKMNDA